MSDHDIRGLGDTARPSSDPHARAREDPPQPHITASQTLMVPAWKSRRGQGRASRAGVKDAVTALAEAPMGNPDQVIQGGLGLVDAGVREIDPEKAAIGKIAVDAGTRAKESGHAPKSARPTALEQLQVRRLLLRRILRGALHSNEKLITLARAKLTFLDEQIAQINPSAGSGVSWSSYGKRGLE